MNYLVPGAINTVRFFQSFHRCFLARTSRQALLIAALLVFQPWLGHADGTVNDCSTPDDLIAALSSGGAVTLVTFNCDGVVTITNTITITNDTVIDGNGNAPTISGDNTFRLFNVNPGVTLTIQKLTIANGTSTNGGGIYNHGVGGGNVPSAGLQGGKGGRGGNGGAGFGGAIDKLGTVTVTDCSFDSNATT